MKSALKDVAILTPRFAARAIQNDIGKDPDPEHTWEEEYTGQLYFEFIRAKLNGTGVDHVLVKINKLIESMPPGLKPGTEEWDQAYRSAFKEAIGVGLENVNNKFIKYVESTERDVKDRLHDTIFAEAERAL